MTSTSRKQAAASSEMAGRGTALFKVALVVFLGSVEGTGWGNFRGYWLTELATALCRGLGFFRGGFLLRGMEKNCGAILRAEVRALAIYLRGVVHFPESVEQLLVAQL